MEHRIVIREALWQRIREAAQLHGMTPKQYILHAIANELEGPRTGATPPRRNPSARTKNTLPDSPKTPPSR